MDDLIWRSSVPSSVTPLSLKVPTPQEEGGHQASASEEAPSPLRGDYIRARFAELASSPAWSGQIEIHSLEDNLLIVHVRNGFVRDWIRETFLPPLKEETKSLAGEDLSIQIIVMPFLTEKEVGEAQAKEIQNLQNSVPDIQEVDLKDLPYLKAKSSVSGAESISPGDVEAPVKEGSIVRNIFHDTLKPKYTFANFVVGGANQFAHAAARAVAQLPGQNYNPLFLYGGVGLGKTHLLNAIGVEALKNNPKTRIIYMTSEKFMNELIYCVRFQKMGDFRKKYRDGCDILLIDDIQFIAGKERTQEEFFHTFNHLHDAQKQIVLTSDKPPRDIPDLEERLKSRFEWGLIADIQVPDLETRMAILKKKADGDGVALNNEVALFLAATFKSNVRELEGSLARVIAFASLSNAQITVDYAKDVLKNVLGPVDKVLTVEQVQKIVAEFFHIKLADLTGKRRVKTLALPRQIAMYLCRKHVKTSYPEIGAKFGGKDHSTVVHAFSKIQKVIATDQTLRGQVEHLEHTITR